MKKKVHKKKKIGAYVSEDVSVFINKCFMNFFVCHYFFEMRMQTDVIYFDYFGLFTIYKYELFFQFDDKNTRNIHICINKLSIIIKKYVSKDLQQQLNNTIFII